MAVSLPKLPAKAAYIYLDNAGRRNAMSLGVLRDMRAQLERQLTSPATGRLLLLPPFRPGMLDRLGGDSSTASSSSSSPPADDYAWLTSAAEWRRQRGGLPSVLVLRSSAGPVFSSGHDLRELAAPSTTTAQRREAFEACASVMSLLRRSPAPVVCAVPHGLATAAGFQLALSCDVAVARAATRFQLPGMGIGLPCTSPVTAVSRRVPLPLAYRMFATAEAVRADQLGGAVDVVDEDEGRQGEGEGNVEDRFEARVAHLVETLVSLPAQPQAMGKWAFWTQAGIRGDEDHCQDLGGDAEVTTTGVPGRRTGQGGDGYEDAARWAAGVMALHARGDDAREGMRAFLSKGKPEWKT